MLDVGGVVVTVACEVVVSVRVTVAGGASLGVVVTLTDDVDTGGVVDEVVEEGVVGFVELLLELVGGVVLELDVLGGVVVVLLDGDVVTTGGVQQVAGTLAE
jgi:hypothetical protein